MPTSTMYSDIRSRQLEGTFPGDSMKGVWSISALRISKGWGAVPESAWPSVTNGDWPGIEPDGLDEQAKALRCGHYQRIRSALEARIALAYGLPVGLAIEVTRQWGDAEMGIIEMPRSNDEIVGTHHIVLQGFDLLNRGFTFVNSWGSEWGNGGFGFLPFAYVDHLLVDAWVTNYPRPPERYRIDGTELLRWTEPDILGHSWTGGDKVYCMEHFDGLANESMGWAFLTLRNKYLDVEELFVRPNYRKRGLAGQMVADILNLSLALKSPLRMWISFSDWLSDQNAVRAIASRLKVSLSASNKRWAPIVGISSRSYEATPPGYEQ